MSRQFVVITTGAPGDSWGGTFIMAADRALIPKRLFAALNLSYDFGRARDYASGVIVDGSELGLNAAATARLLDWLYLGGEVRYLRAYNSLAFGNLVGQAVYLGPTFYLALGRGASLSGAWNIQAWGQTTGTGSWTGSKPVRTTDVQGPVGDRSLGKMGNTCDGAWGSGRQLAAVRARWLFSPTGFCMPTMA